ncbi:hypothetical protein ACEQ8H_006166 [Pleosporales sp. CAS-2024a]
MAANAPYYQVRSHRLVTTPTRTNPTPCQFATGHDEYDPADIPVNAFEENHNLAELLEAATTAAGHVIAMEITHTDDAESGTPKGEGKRKRVASMQAKSAAAETLQANPAMTPKRRRVHMPTTDPLLQTTEHGAVGVHSAAALFRRSTSDKSTTCKYTRPPMSKLFLSLQLTPENFLQLQAQAKTYMLDTNYPDRQNCVGNRGKGDTDMVKLRLFNCVRDFLSDGAGEHFFGQDVEKPGERDSIEAARALGEDSAHVADERLVWPRDGNRIIGLVTPLMRRMVTNERQRMYAIETRKGGGTKKQDKESSVQAASRQPTQSPSFHHGHGPTTQSIIEPPLLPILQPRLASQPMSLPTPLPGAQRPTSLMAMPYPGIMVQIEPVHATNLPLPTHFSTAPNLTNINIFLVLAPNTGSDDHGARPAVKLDQTRILCQDAQLLIQYPWQQLCCEANKLVDRARERYPALQDRFLQLQTTADHHHHHSDDNLRELAAAANAMQDAGSGPSSSSSSSSSSKLLALDCSSSSPPPPPGEETLPPPRHCVVKSVGSEGWVKIESAKQWSELLSQRSREVWADGVVNIVVELNSGHGKVENSNSLGTEG